MPDLFVGACLILATTIATASPLPTRDQNPLLAGFGLPQAMPSSLIDSPHWQVNADFNWASSALVQTDSRERLIVDAETRELHLSIDHTLPSGLAFSFSLPYRSTSAGSLDGFIDNWHDAFGLPEGDRSKLPRDQLRLVYERDGTQRINRRDSMSGVGDVSVAAGLQLMKQIDTALSAWIDLKLPTGSGKDFTGSEALDASLIVAGNHRINERWAIFGQAGVTRLGNGDLLSEIQRRWVGSATAGVSATFWPRVELTLQLDGHTAAFDDSQLDYLNEAVILHIGGSIDMGSKWRLALGVSEDIVVEASPDVVLVIGVRRSL